MKRTFFKRERYEPTVLSTIQRDEVLFFSSPHFLFSPIPGVIGTTTVPRVAVVTIYEDHLE